MAQFGSYVLGRNLKLILVNDNHLNWVKTREYHKKFYGFPVNDDQEISWLFSWRST